MWKDFVRVEVVHNEFQFVYTKVKFLELQD